MDQIRFNPYEQGLVDFAKSHRKQPTKAESLFWGIVRNKQMLGYKFKRENAVGSFILDFYCSELLLGVELDGGYHDDVQDYDEERSIWLNSKYGIKIVRFMNEDIEKNMEGVVLYLEDIIKDREKELGL